MNEERYIHFLTKKELNAILGQKNIRYDLIKMGNDINKWYYQVYYYDCLKNLIAIEYYNYNYKG